MKFKLAVMTLSVAVSLISCDKDDDRDLTAREQKLVAREWKITDITRKSLVDPTEDSSILKACTTDDRLLFSGSRQFQFNDNTTKCDSAIFQYDSGSWELANGEQVLKIDGVIKDQSWKLLTLNDSAMQVEWFDSVSVENKVLKKISFKNK